MNGNENEESFCSEDESNGPKKPKNHVTTYNNGGVNGDAATEKGDDDQPAGQDQYQSNGRSTGDNARSLEPTASYEGGENTHTNKNSSSNNVTQGLGVIPSRSDPPKTSSKPNVNLNFKIVAVVLSSVLFCFLISEWSDLRTRADGLQALFKTQANELEAAMNEIVKLSSDMKDQNRELQQLRENVKFLKSELEAANEKMRELEQRISTAAIKPQEDSDQQGSIWDSLYFSNSDDSQTLKSSDDSSVGNLRSAKKNFERSITRMRTTEFKSQTANTWVQLLSSVASTMSTDAEPARPSAVLLLMPPGMDPSFGPCFARKLAKTVNSAFAGDDGYVGEPKVLDTHYFRSVRSVSEIHEDIKSYLGSSGKAVVVPDLKEIQEEPLLMTLHAFCENSDSLAYDRRANFFSVLPVPEEVYRKYEWTHWKGRYIAKDVLDIVWQTALTEDKRGALVSRIASAVVLLERGDTCV